MITHPAKITLDLGGYTLTVPNDLSKVERHTLIGIILLNEKLDDEDKSKIVRALIQFGRTQMQ